MSAYGRRAFVRQSAMLAGAALLPTRAFAQGAAPHPFFKDMKGPEVIAHRGGAGEWPEETLFALRRAVDARVDVLEVDVRSTCDGVLVLMHDEEVGRTTGGAGCVKDYRFGEDPGGACKDARPLRELDAGHGWPYCCKPRPLHGLLTKDCGKPRRFPFGGRKVEECCSSHPYRKTGVGVPTLEQVLDAFKGWTDTRMVIEIKERDPSTTESFCRTMARYREVQDRILVASFYDTVLDVVRSDRRCEGVALSVATCESLELAGELSARTFLRLLGGAVSCRAMKKAVRHVLGEEGPPPGRPNHAIQVPAALIRGDRDFVRKAQSRNLKVHAWTVNDPTEMWEMMDAGVDGIITDYPTILVKWRDLWRERRGTRPPA